LRELEKKYPVELVVIGVHSGKYHAERVTSRIRDASIRLDSTHPVVNDRQFRTWRSYAVSAWPTLVAVDPAGYVVGAHAGEFTAEALIPFVEAQLATAREKGTLKTDPLHFAEDSPTNATTTLRYPGKVAVDGERIAIADSGNHRVIVGTVANSGTAMKQTLVAGTGSPGFVDGLSGQFHAPQGLAFAGNLLYVADSENHSIRSIALDSGEIKTVAGTGNQMRTRGDQRAGAMSSPWDLALSGTTLFVAMAGVHQLWTVDTRTGQSRVHSGTGGEDIRDGNHLDALLAQPMGITTKGDRVYFADSESNGIRWSDTSTDGMVGTIVGKGLFDFGDIDGEGDAVRLQHPQGILVFGDNLLVADSYNDALKLVNPEQRTSTTWLRGFHEPEGLTCTEKKVYVADTNAHRIAVVDRGTKEVSELRLE
jgi:DNA-binding beta-propeller fold protein YncE